MCLDRIQRAERFRVSDHIESLPAEETYLIIWRPAVFFPLKRNFPRPGCVYSTPDISPLWPERRSRPHPKKPPFGKEPIDENAFQPLYFSAQS